MGFIAKDSSGGGNYKRVPPGSHMARCYSLIDLGTQTSNGQFGESVKHKIQIGWELFGEDDRGQPLTVDMNGKVMPMTIKKSYTISLHEKANLRHDLANWRGRDFTEEEARAFDVANLLGAPCLLSITESGTNGKTYSNVASISRLPTALKNAIPDAVHPRVVFDLDNPDMEVFAGFHDKLQEAIRRSPEWQAKQGNPAISTPTQPAGGFADDFENGIPF